MVVGVRGLSSSSVSSEQRAKEVCMGNVILHAWVMIFFFKTVVPPHCMAMLAVLAFMALP